MNGLLDGRSILVTGAAGEGVGAGVCEAVVEAGGRLALHARTEDEARAAATRWAGAVPVWGDIASAAEVATMVDAAVAACGTLDGVVNNAGVGLHRLFHDASTDDFDRLFGIDVRGTWLVSRAVTRYWLGAGGRGAIVHVSSVHARATVAGYALYAGAKGAIDALTRGMAVELGPHGIRCNAIAPGYVASLQNVELLASLTDRPREWPSLHAEEQQAVGEFVHRRDCGRLAVYLLSSAAAGITGQVVTVDNGTTALLYNRSFTSSPESR